MCQGPDMSDVSSCSARRLVLRPGLPVVRRDDRHLQVGVDAPERTVLEDHPDVRRLLAQLRSGGSPATTTAAAQRALVRLVGGGHVIDAVALEEALAASLDRVSTAAVFAHAGDDAPRRLEQRAAARIEVQGPHEPVAAAARLLGSSGLATAKADDEPTVVCVLTDGEVERGRLDPLVRAGRPHLLVSLTGSSATVGPFVVPGLTACLRCLDAQRGEADPRRATIVEQAASFAAPRPRDPALAALAIAWAVRDITAFVDGDQPSTWSRTVQVGPDLQPVPHAWRRHVHCGCAWDEALVG